MNNYLILLRKNPNYRNLWLARLVSNLGDWFNLMASAALIATLTDSGMAVSYLFLARLLPMFLFSPIAGVLADRFNRRNLLIISDLCRMGIVLCFLLIRDPSQIWLFYLLTAGQFVLSALYQPAHSAVISNIVEPEDLVTANALDGFTWSTMLALGAFLGGIATGLFGLTVAFILDAGTFVLSAWFVYQIVWTRESTHAEASTGGGYFDFIEGLRYLRGRPFILGISLVKTGGSLVWAGVHVLEIPLAEEMFPIAGSGSYTLGMIYGLLGLGTGVGPLLLAHWLGDSRSAMLKALTISFILHFIGVLVLGMANDLFIVAIATLLRGLGSGALWVFSSSLLQQLVDDRFRGRVFAFDFTMLTLAQSISTLLAGVAMDSMGLTIPVILLYMGCVGIVTTIIWGIFVKKMKGAEDSGMVAAVNKFTA